MKKLIALLLWLSAWSSYAQTNREPLYTSFDGTKIHYDVLGSGKPVVLLHGFINTGENWKRVPLRQQLVDAGYQVITLDMRGNGLSDKPHVLSAYENDAEAKDVMGLMDFLGLINYDVIGYSRGSIITARLLVLDKQVRKAVMGGMGTDFTNPNWPRRIAFAELFQGKAHLHPEFSGALNYAKSIGADTVALGFLQQTQPSTPQKALGKVKKPVLVICGDKDADNGSAGELAKLLPKSTLVTVPGTHNDTMRSVAFSEAVISFLGK